MEMQSEGYDAGTTTLEARVHGHMFTAVVPAMVSARDGDDVLVDGEVIADFELRIARWWCDRDDLPGPALKFVRHTLGLKQTDLADLLGFKAETLSRWETGERAVPRLVRVVLGNIVSERMVGERHTLERLQGVREPTSRMQRIELGRFQLRRHGTVLEPVTDDRG